MTVRHRLILLSSFDIDGKDQVEAIKASATTKKGRGFQRTIINERAMDIDEYDTPIDQAQGQYQQCKQLNNITIDLLSFYY